MLRRVLAFSICYFLHDEKEHNAFRSCFIVITITIVVIDRDKVNVWEECWDCHHEQRIGPSQIPLWRPPQLRRRCCVAGRGGRDIDEDAKQTEEDGVAANKNVDRTIDAVELWQASKDHEMVFMSRKIIADRRVRQ